MSLNGIILLKSVKNYTENLLKSGIGMLYRKIETVIEEHLKSDSKKILLIDGARQVGKTYIIRYVGKTSSMIPVSCFCARFPSLLPPVCGSGILISTAANKYKSTIRRSFAACRKRVACSFHVQLLCKNLMCFLSFIPIFRGLSRITWT